jgi:transposase
MFVRKKNNPSGVVSVQIIDKSSGKYKVVKTIGSSSDLSEITILYGQGKKWIETHCGQHDMFAIQQRKQEEKRVTEHLLNNIENIFLDGAQQILDQVFRLTGFDIVEDDILKQLVTARLCQPMSKAATVDYLKFHFDEDVDLNKIYRYLDKLNSTQKEVVQQISVAHTRKILGGKIGLVFYDVTTLYFETDYDDELRRQGFSKDGKHSKPQIVLGLLVSSGGYPLAYSIHEGNKYEGHTMVPVVEDFVKKFNLEDFVVVADSGLLNKDNVNSLEESGYKYIIGAKIKTESQTVQSWILAQNRVDGAFYERQKTRKCRLIIGYSEQRAKKDAHNRNKGIKRLEKTYQTATITKSKINKRGYNKFLELSDDVSVKINYDKIAEDQKWDGFKGYITNTNLPAKMVYQEYSELWQIERAFRITKGTLELRPMFHFTPKRIEAHVCICFVAYKVYKEMERILKSRGVNLSVDKVLNIAKTIVTLKIKLPISGETMSKTMLLARHKPIVRLFEEEFWRFF